MGIERSTRSRRVAVIFYLALVSSVVVYLAHRVWKQAQYSTVTRALVTTCARQASALDDATVYHHVNPTCERFVDRKFVDRGRVKELEYEVDVSINSLAFRNDEYRAEKPAGVTRVILLGDSFVYGLGVRHEETFYRRLEGALNQPARRKYEVWNLAVVSWASRVQRRVVEQPLLGFSPDLVVLFFDDSDLYDNEVYRRLQGPDGRFPAETDMERFWELRERVMQQVWRPPGTPEDAADAARARGDGADAADDRASAPTYAELLDRSAEDIEAMAETLRKASVPFLVVTYPYPQLTAEYERERLSPLYRRLELAGIPRLSLYALFPEESVPLYYFAGNRHWNAAGSARVADSLHAALRERYPSLFPPGG